VKPSHPPVAVVLMVRFVVRKGRDGVRVLTLKSGKRQVLEIPMPPGDGSSPDAVYTTPGPVDAGNDVSVQFSIMVFNHAKSRRSS
jgi:hypothetical protein